MAKSPGGAVVPTLNYSVTAGISTKIKGNVRKTLRLAGLDLVRWRPQSSHSAALARMLDHHRIDTILDVGANEGQYALSLRDLGFAGRIISFEPLAMAHHRLQRSAVKDALWTIPPRTAIGNREGQVQIHVASNGGASSSILAMLDAHRQAAPDVEYVGSEMVPISRLDAVAGKFLGTARNIFLKIDAQGFELPVLQGAGELLRRIAGAQLELSLVALYEGQALFSELLDWMREAGFSIWGIFPGIADNSSGRLLQTDVVFFRD
jgi:FkbM family methyltransferase